MLLHRGVLCGFHTLKEFLWVALRKGMPLDEEDAVAIDVAFPIFDRTLKIKIALSYYGIEGV